jgi:excisionase family DNA binding protein
MHELLTTAEVASRLTVHRSVVTKMVKAGKLTPAHKSPAATGGYLFAADEIDRFISERAA